MKNILAIAAMLLVVSGQGATAMPIVFEANYTRTFGSCPPFDCSLPPATTFAKEFTLESAQLAVDGIYDVASSLSPGLFMPLDTRFNTLSSLVSSIAAVVSGGAVTDLQIDFLQTNLATVAPGVVVGSRNRDFDALGGSWTESFASQYVIDAVSHYQEGTYTIRQVTSVPVTGTAPLLLAAALGMGWVRRRRTTQSKR